MFNFKGAIAPAVGSGLVALALGLAWPSAGYALGPDVTVAPQVSGTAKVGQTLTAVSGKWTGPPGTKAGYTWLRCTDDDAAHCSTLDNSNASTYLLTAADQGKKLRVALWASWLIAWDYMVSNPTAAYVVAANATPVPSPVTPAAPVKTPVPTPTATPQAGATPAPSFDVPPVTGPAPTAGAVLQQTATSLKVKLLKPTPMVRIAGSLTMTGARVTMLTVKAPKGVKVQVTCTGSACPVKVLNRGGGLTRFARLERALPAGTRLRVTISKPGYVSKITTITIRRGAAPARSDRCMLPGHRRTQRCPS